MITFSLGFVTNRITVCKILFSNFTEVSLNLICKYNFACTTGFLNLRLLYNISQPLSLLRKILVYTCSICFYALLIIFNKFLLVNNVKFISIVLIIGMIFANIYMTDFLEECYDWVVKKINQFINKRSRVVSEKK